MNQDIHKTTILVVDDAPPNIDLLKGLLARDYFVQAAINGKMALKIVENKKPDLILLDIMMPEMDGYDVCIHLKENPETESIPIIFLTANVGTEDVIKGFELGAVDYIAKPFKSPELLARVKTHLELKNAREKIENQNKELIEAAKLREDVDQIVRHDLKTPLNAIIGYPQILLSKEYLTEKDKRYIRIISEAGYRMLNMINLSLDLFKMERGVYQLNPVPVDVIKVLKNIEREVDQAKRENDASINIEVSGHPVGEEESVTVSGEELLCYSMLANLIQNALEASPEGGIIHINVDKNDSAIIRIHNKGVVPEEISHKFFEKHATSGKNTGTGLGTYSAKLIAETQQGNISMATSETEGTTITVQLPIQ